MLVLTTTHIPTFMCTAITLIIDMIINNAILITALTILIIIKTTIRFAPATTAIISNDKNYGK